MLYIHVYIYIYIYLFIYTCTFVSTFIYMCMCIYMLIIANLFLLNRNANAKTLVLDIHVGQALLYMYQTVILSEYTTNINKRLLLVLLLKSTCTFCSLKHYQQCPLKQYSVCINFLCAFTVTGLCTCPVSS